MDRGRGRPKGTKKDGLIRFLTDEELTRFFAVANKSKRDGLLFSLVLYFGLRSREAAQLRISDFDFQSLTVTVHGVKRGLTRRYDEVPSQIWHKLRQWLKFRKAHPQNEHLFPHRYLPTEPMTPVGVQAAFKHICEKAGIEGHSVHDLRHTTGRRLALMNFGSFRIARHLRQRDASSAGKYVDLLGDKEAEQKIKEEMRVF
jgi:integrase